MSATLQLDSLPEWQLAASRELAQLPAEERQHRLEAMTQFGTLQASPENALVPPPVHQMGEYLATEIPKPPMLVMPFQVARGALTALSSRAGKGKTTMTLNRALRWSVGRPMFDDLPDVMAPVAALKVLVIENEGSPGFFQEKLGMMADSQGFSAEEREQANENILIWGQGGFPRIKLDDDEDYDMVRRALEEHGPDIVIMDTFRTLWSGEENSATEMQVVLDRVAFIASEYELGVIVTHHERKSGPGDDGEQMSAVRGSTVLEGEAAVMERYKAIRDNVSELFWTKSRFGKAAAPVRMEFVWERWGYDYIPESASRRGVKELLVQNHGIAVTAREVAEELGEPVDKVRRWLNELSADDDEAVKALPSQHTGQGSSGKRYKMEQTDDQTGSLEF